MAEISKFEYFIRIDSQNIINLKVSFDNGLTFDNLDFNQYTLLGKYARTQKGVKIIARCNLYFQ